MVNADVSAPDNELHAEAAFSAQSGVFDQIYSTDAIIEYKRARVRQHVLNFVPVGSRLLELNAGTGEDAIFFAQQGYRVHATDISKGMQNVLATKVKAAGLDAQVSNEICSFTQLNELKDGGPYDAVFSNFGGLNCTGELDKVLASLPALIKSGGTATLVIIPKFCLWETLLVFKGKFRTAFRRFNAAGGRKAHIEGEYFKCWYYNPSYVIKHTTQHFDVVALEGLCTIVPPSYIEGFGDKYPSLFNRLKKWEDRLKAAWPFKYMGDYFVITLRRK
ncbi:ubiquinone/menaquinone biosynthesis C-methylase UbiE [Mucilaginibacter yixingensis]|uniref:Ubiquinone/menaquinone biosynthesis C-methylase UbiE n=1 Tax=Mucilaginibacter yixingensis TaxID=1295612 RepID=A0A2T5J7K1_9SPHI|nr:class I SAM-dependent methyltransferase [Mucilaginibacter yixingensis]PTQ95125.1 ubiquinone/menaquinone biosynthesis C-methylase UbiE [Mucilaginibacter yixingensis]